jgi:protocatechuate 3,4-dioxygenase beta subunit
MALPLIGFFSAVRRQSPKTLQPTPPCDDHDEPTPPMEEGPFFSPRSPERSSLLDQQMAGTVIVISGRVLNTNCKPVANVLLDWWQADDKGEYDNKGYRLRAINTPTNKEIFNWKRWYRGCIRVVRDTSM